MVQKDSFQIIKEAFLFPISWVTIIYSIPFLLIFFIPLPSYLTALLILIFGYILIPIKSLSIISQIFNDDVSPIALNPFSNISFKLIIKFFVVFFIASFILFFLISILFSIFYSIGSFIVTLEVNEQTLDYILESIVYMSINTFIIYLLIPAFIILLVSRHSVLEPLNPKLYYSVIAKVGFTNYIKLAIAYSIFYTFISLALEMKLFLGTEEKFYSDIDISFYSSFWLTIILIPYSYLAFSFSYLIGRIAALSIGDYNSSKKIVKSKPDLSNTKKDRTSQHTNDSIKVLFEKINSGELIVPADKAVSVSKLAYQQKNIPAAAKIIVQFMKNNPNHQDTAEIGLLYAKILLDKNSLEKAYKVTKSLIKKYENHPIYPELKNHLIKIRRKIAEI